MRKEEEEAGRRMGEKDAGGEDGEGREGGDMEEREGEEGREVGTMARDIRGEEEEEGMEKVWVPPPPPPLSSPPPPPPPCLGDLPLTSSVRVILWAIPDLRDPSTSLPH